MEIHDPAWLRFKQNPDSPPKMERNHFPGDIHSMSESLNLESLLFMAKFSGQIHLENLRSRSSLPGIQISNYDLKKVLAYNDIKDLEARNIDEENVPHVRERARFIINSPKPSIFEPHGSSHPYQKYSHSGKKYF